MAETLEYALDCIIFYDCHEEWLEQLATELEKSEGLYNYRYPFEPNEWHTEEHIIWMLLVGMFGEWGTSIRSGWITEMKEAAEYIRNLLKRVNCEEGADNG